MIIMSKVGSWKSVKSITNKYFSEYLIRVVIREIKQYIGYSTSSYLQLEDTWLAELNKVWELGEMKCKWEEYNKAE